MHTDISDNHVCNDHTKSPLDIHQQVRGLSRTPHSESAEWNKSVRPLSGKGYSSRIHSRQKPSRPLYCCQTKLFSPKSNLLEESSHLQSGPLFLISFYNIQKSICQTLGFSYLCFHFSNVQIPHRIKSKTGDVANERLHNLASAFPPASSLHTLFSRHTEFLPGPSCPRTFVNVVP